MCYSNFLCPCVSLLQNFPRLSVPQKTIGIHKPLNREIIDSEAEENLTQSENLIGILSYL